MGWGKKTTGAKPQPEKFAEALTLVDAPKIELDLAPREEVAPKEKPSDAAKAQLEWHQFKSKKGWTDETLALVLYEFVQAKGLFNDLVKFAKGRR